MESLFKLVSESRCSIMLPLDKAWFSGSDAELLNQTGNFSRTWITVKMNAACIVGLTLCGVSLMGVSGALIHYNEADHTPTNPIDSHESS